MIITLVLNRQLKFYDYILLCTEKTAQSFEEIKFSENERLHTDYTHSKRTVIPKNEIFFRLLNVQKDNTKPMASLGIHNVM